MALYRSPTIALKENMTNSFFLHCSWYLCRVAAVERLPVLYDSADYISFPLGSLGLIMVQLKIRFCSCIR